MRHAALILFLSLCGMQAGDVGPGLRRPEASSPRPGPRVLHRADTSFTLVGVVRESSGRPVAGAAVFLNHTTYGDGTDDAGRFTVKAPAGAYELIVSHIAYEPLRRAVHLDASTSGAAHALDLVLTPRTHTLGELTVNASSDPMRQRRLRQFERDLLGEHSIDRKAELRNPEAVGFETTEEGFKAWFLAPLRIENGFTGYRMEVYMARYERAEEHYTIRYYVRFEEAGACDPALQERRQEAYLGSFQHFIDSWLRGRLREQGFAAQLWDSGRDLPALPVRAVAVLPPVDDRIVVDYVGRADLRFEDYLIRLFGSRTLRKRGDTLYPVLTQRSFVTLRGPVKISPNGALVGPIRTEGYWGFRGLGGAVPSTFSARGDCVAASENKPGVGIVDGAHE